MNYIINYCDCGGYDGNNAKQLHGGDLKKAITEQLKENGYKLTSKKSRGGWTDHFIFTFKVSVNDFKTFKNINDYIEQNFTQYNRYKEYNYSDSEILQINSVKVGDIKTLNHYYIKECTYISDELKEKMIKANNIIQSYNYDHSDVMTDYFDVGFYYDINLQVI